MGIEKAGSFQNHERMGMGAVASAIGSLENANLQAQIETAGEGITIAPGEISLQQQWSKTISIDAFNYAEDTELSTEKDNQKYAVYAAQANQQMSLDQTQSDLENGKLQAVMENLKSIVGYLGMNLKSVFEFQTPVEKLMDQTSSQIMKVK